MDRVWLNMEAASQQGDVFSSPLLSSPPVFLILSADWSELGGDVWRAQKHSGFGDRYFLPCFRSVYAISGKSSPEEGVCTLFWVRDAPVASYSRAEPARPVEGSGQVRPRPRHAFFLRRVLNTRI